MSVRRGPIMLAALAAASASAMADFVPLDLSEFNGANIAFEDAEVTVNSTKVVYDGEFVQGPLGTGTSSGDLSFGKLTRVEIHFAAPVIVTLSQQRELNWSATAEDHFWISTDRGAFNVLDNESGELTDIQGNGTSSISFGYNGLSGAQGSAADKANGPWSIQSSVISSLVIFYDGDLAPNRGALNLAVSNVPAPAAATALLGTVLLGRRRRA